jgi:hypothetical protein
MESFHVLKRGKTQKINVKTRVNVTISRITDVIKIDG